MFTFHLTKDEYEETYQLYSAPTGCPKNKNELFLVKKNCIFGSHHDFECPEKFCLLRTWAYRSFWLRKYMRRHTNYIQLQQGVQKIKMSSFWSKNCIFGSYHDFESPEKFCLLRTWAYRSFWLRKNMRRHTNYIQLQQGDQKKKMMKRRQKN